MVIHIPSWVFSGWTIFWVFVAVCYVGQAMKIRFSNAYSMHHKGSMHDNDIIMIIFMVSPIWFTTVSLIYLVFTLFSIPLYILAGRNCFTNYWKDWL